MNNDESTKQKFNKFVDYWTNQVGMNCFPAATQAKTVKKGIEWKQWQHNPIPAETTEFWKARGDFNEGIGLIPGKVWRGPNAGKYLIFLDLDNKKAIDEFCTQKDKVVPLSVFAEKFIVEQHRDNANKAHIYFYSVVPFEKKSSDVLEKEMVKQSGEVDVPLFEVKGKGSHGIAFCTPSLHKDGYPYEIIGTSDPMTLDEFQANEMKQHLDSICKKYGLHYLDHGNGDTKTPMESLYEEDFVIYEGQNRHEALLRFMDSVIKKNKKYMHLPNHIIKQVCHAWNDNQCRPPLNETEFEKQWKAANEYVGKKLQEEGHHLSEEEKQTAEKVEELAKELEQTHITAFRNPNHNLPVFRIADLGVDLLDTYVVVSGTVIGVSELVPSWKMVKWLCKICGGKNNSDKYDMSRPPKTCEFCSEDEGFLPELDTAMMPRLNQQSILLQDNGNVLTCVLTGPFSEMNKVKAGQKVQALGIQRYKTRFNRRNSENEWVKYFELLDIKASGIVDVNYTEKDVEYFKELAASVPDLIADIILPSFAPHVRGNMDGPKLVCIYTLGSQGLERPFNSLLVGPPAKGKTQCTSYTSEMSHNGSLTTFINTSIAGLTTETVTDPVSGSRMTKPGSLGMYSMACFTDLNGVMDVKDGKKLMLSLNDALERKVLTVAKAGGTHSFAGRCAVLMDSNNFQATWYYDERIDHNLQFVPKSFLSRIDLIGLVPEGATDEHNDAVSDANYESYMATENAIRLHEGDWVDELTGKPRLGFESLRKYFLYVSQQPLPPLPNEAEYKAFFRTNYRQVLKKDKEFLIDGRYLRTCMILARVRARLLLKPVADKSELDYAIAFVNKCKHIETVDPKTGQHDANYLLGANSKSEIQREEDINKMNQWVTACHNAMAHSSDGYFSSTDLINELGALPNAKWTDFGNIMQFIQECYDKGRLMKNQQNRYKWLDVQ